MPNEDHFEPTLSENNGHEWSRWPTHAESLVARLGIEKAKKHPSWPKESK